MFEALLSGMGSGLADLFGTGLQAHENRRGANSQMQFQKQMRDTAYQAAAADLEKAGLNRVLALGSPAASPSGASYSVDAPRPGTSYTQAASAKAAIEQSHAQVQAIEAQESATRTNEANAKALLPFQLEQLQAQTSKDSSTALLQNEQARLARLEAARAEVMKGIYQSVGPSAQKAFDALKAWLEGDSAKGINSPVDAVLNFFQPDSAKNVDARKKLRDHMAKPIPRKSRGASGEW